MITKMGLSWNFEPFSKQPPTTTGHIAYSLSRVRNLAGSAQRQLSGQTNLPTPRVWILLKGGRPTDSSKC